MKFNLKTIGLVSIAAAVGIFFIYKYNKNKKNRRRKPNQQPSQPSQPSRPTLPEDVELVPNIDIDALLEPTRESSIPTRPLPTRPLPNQTSTSQPSRPLPNLGTLGDLEGPQLGPLER